MRLQVLIMTLFLISCGQNSSSKKETQSYKDSIKTAADTPGSKKEQIKSSVDKSGQTATALSIQVNRILNDKPGNKWHVLNDGEARWISGQFDYFITPKRKENPDYPYIAKGDFNGDEKPDIAALVTDSSKRNYQLVIIMNADEDTNQIITWKEDIAEDAAISFIPKSVIEGFEGEKTKKIKMKADGINVEYFETSSFVLYWSGSAFKRIWTGD